MEKLSKLIDRCKCGVHISINEHRDYHETVEQYFNSHFLDDSYLEDIDEDVFKKMKETNTIVDLHYYPDSSNGFYKIFHYDLEMAIDEALLSLKIN